MGQARIVCTDWPIIVIEWPAEARSADIDAHFSEMAHILASRHGRFAAVVDAASASSLASMLRAEAANGVRRIVACHGTRMAGCAYVVPSPALRGIVTAIHWVVGTPFPVTTVPSREEAVTWARRKVAPRHPRASTCPQAI